MKKNYKKPEIELLVFDEVEVLTASDAEPTDPPSDQKKMYDAARDVGSQIETVINGRSGSISTVRLEDINVQ